MNPGDSNPVVPTIFSLGKRAPTLLPLSSPLSSGEALAEAARALAKAALAIAEALGAQHAEGTFAPLSRPQVAPPSGVTVIEAVNDFLVFKARLNRSDRYLRQLRTSLSSFCQGRSRQALGAVTMADLETWVTGQGWAPRTQRGYLADVATLYNWATRRGYCSRNPAAGIELAEAKETVPAILTPAEAKALLEHARRADLQVCRFLAVCLFAGVRSAEAHRLREADLLPGFVQVPAAKAKTRSRRLVTVQPALAAWLGVGGELGPLSPNRVRAVIRGSGVTWAQNVARHSFVSYHLAAFDSAGRTAAEAGHSEAILFRHYRALVTREQAEAFWSLRPNQ